MMTRSITPDFTQIVVEIDEVDLPNRTAHVRDKTNALIQVTFREAPGAVFRVPNKNERWTAQRIGFQWHLDQRLDSVDEHDYVKKAMAPGDTRISADGTVHVLGSGIVFNGQPIGATSYSAFTSDGVITSFTLGIAPIHPHTVQAFINGLLIDPRSFRITGVSVVFLAAPAAGTLVVYYQRSGFVYEDAALVRGIASISAAESQISNDAFPVVGIALISAIESGPFLDAASVIGVAVITGVDSKIP